MSANAVSILVLVVIAESVWETCKLVWQNGKISVDRIGAMVVGIILSIGTGTDILALAGVELKIPYVGMILTGLLISRGSNFIHDFVKGISGITEKVTIDNEQKTLKNGDKN